jgi:glycosyltransferase involved in cell wall biosynthesis
MNYVAITPAYNEEPYIRNILESMCAQRHPPDQWVIVDDCSTDATADIVREYQKKHPWITLVRNPVSEPRMQGPKIVRAFNLGFGTLTSDTYGFVVKLDADISLPPDYFERVAHAFEDDREVGICGGVIRFVTDRKPRFSRDVSDYDHVSGTIKSYRRECFDAMGGLRIVHGWDVLDEHLARYHGWKIKTIFDLEIVHHRKPVRDLGAWTRSYNAGRWYHRMSYGTLATCALSVQQSFHSPVLIAWLPTLVGFFHAKLEGDESFVDPETGEFIRQHMNERLIAYIKRNLLFRNHRED